MKIFRSIFFAFFILTFSALAEVYAQPVEKAGENQDAIIDLHACSDEGLAINFLCNPDWELQTDEDVLFVVISSEPEVTMTIARADSPVVFLDQLADPYLQEIGGYEEGFVSSRIMLGSREAVRVEGVSSGDPDMQMEDYYLLDDFNLYSVLFSVYPKEEWPKYKELFSKIVKSVQFPESKDKKE